MLQFHKIHFKFYTEPFSLFINTANPFHVSILSIYNPNIVQVLCYVNMTSVCIMLCLPFSPSHYYY